MGVTYVRDGIKFSWDPAKAASNRLEHDVSFEEASEVLLDPFVKADEPTERNGEVRVVATGLTSSWLLLRVTFSFIDDLVRIISARKATARERKTYEAG